MIKRWLIRALFLLPLVCVAAAWVTSYFVGMVLASRQTRNYALVAVVLGQGVVGEEVAGVPIGRAFLYRFDPDLIRNPPDLGTTAGFHFGAEPGNPDSFLIIFPLWLPTLLLLALNWLAWRKTRPKLPGRAFPIEPTAKPGESNP